MRFYRTLKLGMALAFSSVLATTAAAEEANALSGKFALGLQGGLTFADFDQKNTGVGTGFSSKTGWMGGLFLEFGLWTITLRPEVNYVRKKYDIGSSAEMETNRLELNALLKLSPFGPMIISPFILIGPQWSNHLDTKVNNRSGFTVAGVSTAEEWDLAGVAGLGLDINVAESIALGAQGRYILGFRDLHDGGANLKTRDVQALATITFQDAF